MTKDKPTFKEAVKMITSGNLSAKPGAKPDPEKQFKTAVTTCYVVAAMNLLVALAATIVQHDDFMSIPEAIAMFVVALVFFGLAHFAKKKKDRRLFLVGLVILGLDLVISLASGMMGTGFIVVRALFMLFLWQGYKSVKKA